jgi:hypothetical protein
VRFDFAPLEPNRTAHFVQNIQATVVKEVAVGNRAEETTVAQTINLTQL